MTMDLRVRGQMTTGQGAAVRGGSSPVGAPKKSFASKLGDFAKGVGKVALGVGSAALGALPGGNVLGAALNGAFGNNLAAGGGFGSSAGMSASGGSMVSEMAKMNMEFMALQNAVQNESRKYQVMSNASRSRHDIAMNAVRNMKA